LAAYGSDMKLPVLGIALGVALGCSRGAPTDQQQSKTAAGKPSQAAAPQPTPAQAQARPAARRPVDVGSKAPAGELAEASGVKIALADILREHKQNVVVFYRGFY